MTVKKDWHTATLGNKATIKDAIKKLSASSLQIILVIEENNLLLGTITDGDIRRAILRGSTLDGNLKDLMNKDNANGSLAAEMGVNPNDPSAAFLKKDKIVSFENLCDSQHELGHFTS